MGDKTEDIFEKQEKESPNSENKDSSMAVDEKDKDYIKEGTQEEQQIETDSDYNQSEGSSLKAMTTNAIADEISAGHDVSSEPCQEDICVETDVTKVENKNEVTKDDPESEENKEETGKISGIFSSDKAKDSDESEE